MGDAVLVSPLVLALRRFYPKAKLCVLAEKRNGGIFLCGEGLSDTLYLYDRGLDLIRTAFRKYDLIIDTEQSHYLSALLTWLMPSRFSVGFGTNEREILFDRAVSYSQRDYEVESFLKLFEALTHDRPTFHPEEPFFQLKKELSLSSAGGGQKRINGGKPCIVMAPGATIVERRWGWRKFRDLAEKLEGKEVRIILVGSRLDREEGRNISEGLEHFVENKIEKTSLSELITTVLHSDILVSTDTGVLHLAYAVGTPAVALFGSGIEAKWAPPGRNYRVINKNLPCSPCTLFGETPPCPNDVACLESITVKEVEEALLDLLKEVKRESVRK